jgi:heme-degrading monooxygenase HmoA
MAPSIRVARRSGQWEDCPDVSFAAVFLYEVDNSGSEAFEAVYGPEGDWARFFAAGDGYRGTELLRAGERYLLIDRWRSRTAYEAFLAEHADEYARRNADARALWRREEEVGRFENA